MENYNSLSNENKNNEDNQKKELNSNRSKVMDIDTFDVLTIGISTKMITFVNNQTTFTLTMRHTTKCYTIDVSSNNQIVTFFYP